MQVQCKFCGSAIDASAIDLQLLVAVCRHCLAVTGIRDRVPGAAPPRLRAIDGVTFDRQAGAVLITLCWRRATPDWLGKTMGVVVLAAMGALLGIGILHNLWPLDAIEFMLAIIIQLGIVAAIYSLTAWRLNATILALTQSELIVRVGPVPWPGSLRLARDQIDELVITIDRAWAARPLESPAHLSAQMRSGERVRIVTQLPSLDEAIILVEALNGAGTSGAGASTSVGTSGDA